MPDWLDADDPSVTGLFADDAQIRQVATGFAFTEGPVWTGDSLLFADIPRNRIVRYRRLAEGPELTTFRYPSGYPLDAPLLPIPMLGANGLTLDAEGRLIACERGNRRVTRTLADGSIVPIAERYHGKRLNLPNDVIASVDGSIIFTDPAGVLDEHGLRELSFRGVYRADPDGRLTLLADDFTQPNGLAFSPDESLLYINDTRRNHIRVFEVLADGSIGAGREFASVAGDKPGVADGMKVDRDGNVYCTGSGGVWIFRPDGSRLGRIRLPEQPANLAWGGDDWRSLFFTARASIYHVAMTATGVPVPPASTS